MSLKAKLDAARAKARTDVPAGLQDVIENRLKTLIASGQAEQAMKAGDRAPSFRLPDTGGKIVESSGLLKRGPLVLTFFRGAWCPYCNLDLQALETVHKDIRSHGASLVAVSPQTPHQSNITQRNNKISFQMLSDKGGELAESFGIRTRLPIDLQTVFKELDIDLIALNGETSWTLPMPARFVISQDGIIAFSEIDSDYTHRPEPGDLLPTLKRLAQDKGH